MKVRASGTSADEAQQRRRRQPSVKRAVVVLTLLIAAAAGFFWLAIFFANWFVPTRAFAWGAGPVILIPTALAFLWRAPYKRLRDNLAAAAGCAIFLWLLIVQVIPALYTRSLGTEEQSLHRVASYYWSTGSCKSRLEIEEFGSFCRAGSEGAFVAGHEVRITYRRSLLGRYVVSIVNEPRAK